VIVTPWIILAAMAAFAAGFVLATLLHRIDGHRAHATANVSDQPKERAGEQPSISDDGGEARTASVEVGQPALAAGRAERTILTRLAPDRGAAAVVALGGIIMLGLVGYFAAIEPLGPTSGSSPTHSEGALAIERLSALTSQPHIEFVQPPSAGGLASVDDMIDGLADRLRKSPDDPEGWRMLGWSYFSTERFTESAAAYLKAIALRPDLAAFRTLRGEALVKAAKGKVTPEAAQVFDEALKLDPADPQARIFKGLAKQQAGDGNSALDDWIAILNGADSNEPWVAELKQRVAELGREIGTDISGRLRDRQAVASGDILKSLAGPPASTDLKVVRNGPTDEDIRAAEAMVPADQTAMIRGMVEGLAARLEKSPRDVEGWIKLIQSRIVLGQADEAKRALDRALTTFGDFPREREQIAIAAQELGLMRK
jgi:cytochrome c-type biogenesis protein CcmH